MYEMCTGLDEPGTTFVWHVKAKNGTVALCGLPLETSAAKPVETDRHCPSCMTSFGRLVDQRG
ncbi:hypothetical protein ACIP39_12855 [Streptomyces tibetensis]|uniref:hypothetical protein n=1 Tax=Streptomyces tibetensis TaxID=2382123 RepID=UPI0037F712B4